MDPVVEQTLNRTKQGEDEHRTRTKRYDDSYKIWRPSSKQRRTGDPWQSNLKVPYGMQVIDTAMVNMVSGKPRVIVKARQPGQDDNAKAMQAVLDYFVSEDHLVEAQPAFVQQALIYGVTVAKNHWLYKETTRPVRSFHPNPIGFGAPMEIVEKQKVITRDGPHFEPWNVYDAWWDPNARDVDTADYVVLRTWATKDQLLAMQYNPDTGDGIYQNLDQLWATVARRPNQSAQESLLGGSQARRKGMFEILEVWRDDRLTVIGNRQVLLRDEDNIFWHGKKPIVVAQVRPDLFEIQGVAETELVDHLQQALQTVQNMRMDNMHMTVMRGFTYREGGVTDPNALQLRPRFKWPVMDHDDIRPVDMQPLPPEAYREEEELLSRLQLVTGINPYVSGASSQQGVDQNTATGVTALQDVASRLLRFKAAQIHNKGYQRTYEQWGDMIQQFLDHDVAVKIIGRGGQETWVQLGPQEVAGHFTYHLEGSEESLSRQQERSEAIGLLNALGPLFPMGILNPKPVIEKVAAAFGFQNPDEILAAPQAPVPPAAPNAPMGGVPPQGGPPGPGQLLGGQQMSPQVLQAIQGR